MGQIGYEAAGPHKPSPVPSRLVCGPRGHEEGYRRGSNPPPPSRATIRCHPLQCILVRPVFGLIYGVFGDFGEQACPLRTSLYQLGCSTSPSETNAQRDTLTNHQSGDGYILPRAAGHAGCSGQGDGEPAVLASWTLTTSSTTCSQAVTSTSSRSWLSQRVYGQVESELHRGPEEVVQEI